METRSLIRWFEQTFDWKIGAITLVCLVLIWLIGHYGVKWLIGRLSRVERFGDTTHLIIECAQKPLTVVVYAMGVTEVLDYLDAPKSVLGLTGQLFQTWIVVSIGIALYYVTPTLMKRASTIGQTNILKTNAIMRSFTTTLLQVLLITVIGFAVLDIWNINVNGLLAGAGLTGLAISMAAQDQIRNFLGGAVIIAEKSFSIGDAIESPSIEGTVEDITFRSTKLRTPAGALQVVPNSTLANEPITNKSRVDVPRITLDYYLNVGTTEAQLTQFKADILDFLKADQRFMASHMEYQVNVLEITSTGIHLQVNGPLSDMGIEQINATKADLNLAMIDMAKKRSIKFVQVGEMMSGDA